jgi:peptidoglycan/xylan/chitin deacetylase (PgdA/CDA1 family)
MLRWMLGGRALLIMIGAVAFTLAVNVAGASVSPYSAGSVVYRVPVAERVVALTFDDGPPFGALDSRIRGPQGIAADHGQTLLMWSVETRDWATRSPRAVAVGTLREVEPGAVVLLHDGGGDREHVVTATRWMVGHLAREGYHFVTVPQLFEMAAPGRRR